jgi:glutathione synthase/RimK-type ligase-like ATP-grasp enzyme
MKKLRILPYKPGSNSAKLLAQALNGLRVRFHGTFRPRQNHLVVNWGSPRIPHWWVSGFNHPDGVARATNKSIAFRFLHDAHVSIPSVTTSQEIAQQWVNDGAVVVGRAVLNGHGGIGCQLFGKDAGPQQVQPLPLYTKHVRHKREFRIHVFCGKVIDEQEKRKAREIIARNPWIRNHNNGYVFARNGLAVPECVKAEAIKAVAALGLDFGAVDVAYREKENQAFVLEVNTAPGLEGQTIQSYVQAIQEKLLP